MLPVLMVLPVPLPYVGLAVSAVSLLCLALLGVLSGLAGGASPWLAAARITFWGVVAMAATAAVGSLFGTTVM
jgi:VIT1/CCC1 family predicted Fe2+/Mn2+ transporter